MSGFADEFGSEYAVESEIVEWFAANGWEDSSWHNNICPSWSLEYLGTRGDLLAEVFVDAIDPAERECGPEDGPRFSVHIFDEDGELSEDCPDFDTFEQVKARIAELVSSKPPAKTNREKLAGVRASLSILAPRLTDEFREMLKTCDQWLREVHDDLPEDPS